MFSAVFINYDKNGEKGKPAKSESSIYKWRFRAKSLPPFFLDF